MLKFIYKAQRIDNGEWVIGRVGHPYIVHGGVKNEDTEIETFFFIFDKNKKKWNKCVVKTDSIVPVNISESNTYDPFLIEGKEEISDEEIVARMKILTLFNRKSITDEELKNLLQMVLLVNNLERTTEARESIICKVNGD